MGNFTPQQKILAEYVAQHLEKICFFSVNELAASAGVSNATVIRFCHRLGFKGYAHFAREIKEKVQAELNTLGRFNLSRDLYYSMSGKPKSHFELILRQEIENITNLAKIIRKVDFAKAVEWIAESHFVIVCAAMGSSPLADYLGYALDKILPHVEVKHNKNEFDSSLLDKIDQETIFILIAFPRYPSVTLELAKMAKKFRAKVVVITDSHSSPITPFADIVFLIPIGMSSFVDAYSAPLAFMHALVRESGEKNPQTTKKWMRRFENYVKEFNLFHYKVNPEATPK